ncbi:MAG: helix-turn-helix transcriptional regulator [Actinobacteria bacterium]|nr:helix-turn-helix transcriptional regulator [Actinomycetota bacterium]
MFSTTRQRRESDELIDARFAKAIAHPLRVRIMVELDRGPMSPAEYAAKFEEETENVWYHFRILAECDCIEVVGERSRRGATEHFYANCQHALFSEEQFSRLPAAVRGSISASILSTFMDQAAEALLTNRLDSHDSRHLTWQRLELDEEGFAEVMGRMDELFEWLPVAQMAAHQRMKKSDEKPLITAVGLFGFECPKPERDHDLTSP